MLQASLPSAARSGGVGFQVDLLATALACRGHDVTAFVVEDPPERSAYRCVQVPVRPNRVARVVAVGRAFARLDLSEYDVVHAHGDDWLFGRRRRVRTFYGSALMEARTATRMRRRVAQICYYALEWVSSTNPHSVAISESTRQYLPLVRASIPCAVDNAAFYPGGERTAEPTILFVAGTLQGRKRGGLLLRAFAEVRQAIPEARLTIVSSDRVDMPGVTCVSRLAAHELGALYRSHWLLCSTSSYEGFGVPYAEALASGLPIVTTPNDGALEVLQDGTLGVLTAPDRVGEEVVALIRDGERRDRLSVGGVEAAASYAIDAVADRYEALYSSSMRPKGSPAWRIHGAT